MNPPLRPIAMDRAAHGRSPDSSGAPRSPRLEDDQLITRLRAGDRASFDILWRRHQPRLSKLAYFYLGDRELARDCVQEAMLGFHRQLDRYEARGKLAAWLNAFVINACRSAAAKQKSRRRFEWLWSQMRAQLPPVRPEDQSHAKRDLRHYLLQLSPSRREALILRLQLELSFDEIAQSSNISVSAAKSRVYDGLEQLRKLSTEEFEA